MAQPNAAAGTQGLARRRHVVLCGTHDGSRRARRRATTLGAFDERKSKVIELRFFGGLSLDETAEALGVSVATISRELRFAQAWLQRELERTGS